MTTNKLGADPHARSETYTPLLLARYQRDGAEPGLPQGEIERIAEQIARAHTDPRPDDWRDDSFAQPHELAPGDGNRVIAALLRRAVVER